jgi:hypothetical protein
MINLQRDKDILYLFKKKGEVGVPHTRFIEKI